MNQKKVIITGVTGQMGSIFSRFLLESGYSIVGTKRRSSTPNLENAKEILKHPNFSLEEMDLSDPTSIKDLVKKVKPEYFINCAANSFVGSSWTYPVQHMQCNAIGVLHQLEAIKDHCPLTRYVNFGSSEEFGNVAEVPQTEKTELRARSPYAASKIAARHLVKVYRESYDLFAIQPWCFNYESPSRGREFVSRKITTEISRIAHSLEYNKPFDPMEIGNIFAKRDWSHAKDIAKGVWLMLNQFEPKNYVLSSGKTHTVYDLINLCLKYIGVPYYWAIEFEPGAYEEVKDLEKVKEKDYLKIVVVCENKVLVKINPKFFRPCEVSLLHGSSDLIKKELGWQPEYTFEKLINEMMFNDLKLAGVK